MKGKREMNWKRLINRETISYGFFGVLTTLENLVLFRLLLKGNVAYQVANFITLIVVKLTAYLCNKNFVFHSRTGSWLELLKEFGRFVITRGFTMVLDYVCLILAVELLHMDPFISKCLITILVVVTNYFLGKNHVFLNKTE